MKEVNWMQQGWECPKCGAVMSPHTDCCVNCRGNTNTNIFVTGTTIGDPPPTADVPPYSNTTTSTSSPLDPPYVLKKQSSHDEWWETAQLNGYKAESHASPAPNSFKYKAEEKE